MKKTPPHCPPFERSVGAMAPLCGAPAYRYQQSLPRCITCQDVCVQQSNAQKLISYRNLKWTLEDLLPCYCYTIKINSRTIRLQVWQPASAGKGADMSERQAHHCMTPEQALLRCECHSGKWTYCKNNVNQWLL